MVFVLWSTTLVSYAMTDLQKDLWKIAKSGAVYPMGYFKGVDANIKNEEGQTPLMIATQNGHSDVIRSLSDAKVNLKDKDNAGKTAFDYIKMPSNGVKALSIKRAYGALRVLEVEQLIKGHASMVSYSYENDIDFLSILIRGETCYMFKLPKNTKCKAIPKRKKTSHDIFKAIKTKDNKLFDTLLKEVDLNIINRHDYSLLWAGIHYKNMYVVDRVLKAGADINKLDNNQLHKPISWAIIQNETSLMQVLIDNGVDVNSKDKFGNPILFKAMYKCKSFETVRLLLDNGANSYLTDARGKTVFDQKPVFCKDKLKIAKMIKLLKEETKANAKDEAIEKNKKLLAKYKEKSKLEDKLRSYGKLDRYISTLSDVNTRDKQGYTALHKAVKLKYYKAIEELLEKGADMYALESQFAVWTPFNYALAIDDKKALKMFLDNGADINFHHKKGSTLLNSSIRACNLEMIQFLLNNGANPRVKDGYGSTVESSFKKCEKQEKIKIKSLIKLALLSGKNSTLLKVEKKVFKSNKESTLIKKLKVRKKYKKEIQNSNKPIFIAIAYKNKRDFDKYLKNIDNIELMNENRKTLLYMAVEERNYYAIEKLLQRGAKMNFKEKAWMHTPFTYALALNLVEAIEMFLKNGANANYQYNKSLTVLAIAVKQCNIDMIKLLLKNGANPKLEDKRGDSAVASLGHCNKKDNKKIEQLIKNSKGK